MTDVEKVRELNRLAVARYKKRNKTALADQRKTPEWRAKRAAYLREWYQRPEVKQREHARQNRVYATDPEFRKKRADYGRRKRSGITPELVTLLLEKQQGCCYVCKRSFQSCEGRGLKFHADHCHDTGQPRGLLCTLCNTAEGAIRKAGLSALEFGQRMHDYLLNPPAKAG